MTAPFLVVPRKSEERGHADLGWLKTSHTFSTAMYQSAQHQQHGPLRVISEDRVAPQQGFGMHSHREFEIFSYIVSGQLEHKDSLGNSEILNRGDLQMTSTGTGISHSEKTYGSKEVHFLQIWALPSQSRLPPTYFTRHFSDEEKHDQWARIVAPVWSGGVNAKEREADGPAPINSALTLYATILSQEATLERSLGGPKAYVHVIQRSEYNEGPATGATIEIDDGLGGKVQLREGDGAYVTVNSSGSKMMFRNIGDRASEILVFDLD